MLNRQGNTGNAESRARGLRPGRDTGVAAGPRPEIGFATRLRFLSMAELEAARAARYGLPLGVALFVLEELDSLRASFQQDLERCDWEIGNRLAAGIRQGPDLLARFGLGEWALLLPHTGLDGAISVAQRGLQRLRDLELGRPGVVPQRLSISAGVAAHQPVRRYGVETVTSLLLAAERAQRQSSALGNGQAVGWAADSAAATA